MTYAQDSSEVMKVYSFQEYSSEHTNPEKNRNTYFMSGTQADTVLNITMVSTPRGIIELKINNIAIEHDKIKDYQILTDFIYDYAKTPRSKVASKEDKNVPKKIEPKTTNDIIVTELIKDGLMTEETRVYDVLIGYDKMFFNGKKQSDAFSKKYRALYEKHAKTKLQPTTYFQMSQTLGE